MQDARDVALAGLESRVRLLEGALSEALSYLPATEAGAPVPHPTLDRHWTPERARACRERIERNTGITPHQE